MFLSELVQKLFQLQVESDAIRTNTSECDKYIDDLIRLDHVNVVDFKELVTALTKELYIDKDLFINILEQQIEKNQARLNEIKSEIDKLKSVEVIF